MKKVFFIFAFVLVVSGITISPSLSYAQIREGVGSGVAGAQAVVSPAGAAATAQAEAQASSDRGAAGSAAIDTVGGVVNQGTAFAQAGLMSVIVVILEIIIRLITWVLWIVGIMFNIVVRETVVEMGKYITSESAGGIRVAWQIMRDVANIAIIGGIIASAVGTILNITTINAQKWLVRLIIAALLVNFSYFFAGAIIDSSNFLATSIFKSTITTKDCATNTPGSSAVGILTSLGYPPEGQGGHCTVADRFLALVNIQKLRLTFGDATAEARSNPLEFFSHIGERARDGVVKIMFYDLLFIVLELVSIFVFLSAITLLIGRFVALIFVLISSPLGIAGLAVPGVSKYAKQWWEALFSQAFFAPVYFILLGFSFAIIDYSKDAILAGTSGFDAIIGIILTFTVASVFMLQSLRIAKSLSERTKALADAYKGTNWIAGWMPGAYVSGLRAGARETIGRSGDVLGHWYEEKIAGKPQAWLGGKRLDQVAGLATIDRSIQGGLKGLKDAKFGGKKGYGDIKEEREQRTIRVANVAEYGEKKEEVLRKGGLKDQNDEVKKRYDEFVAKNGRVPTKEEIEAFSPEWKNLKNTEEDNLKKKKITEAPEWEGRRWVKDKDGNWGWETEWGFKDRAMSSKRFEINGKDKDGKDVKKSVSLSEIIAEHKGALTDVSAETLKEEYKRSPKTFKALAGAMTTEQIMSIYGDKTIDRDVRDELRKTRYGSILKDVENFEKNVVVDPARAEDKQWLDSNGFLTEEAKKAGKVLRYSTEYNDRRYFFHEYFKKNGNPDELEDLYTSKIGIEAGLQENETFNDAITDGLYMQLQKNRKIAAGKKRAMRGLKRARLNTALKMDEQASAVFDVAGISESERNRLAQEIGELDETAYATRVESASGQEKEVIIAARKRAVAEARAGAWMAGKAPIEVQNEIKQEMLGARLMGKLIRRSQAQAVDKDQTFMDDQSISMLTYGDDETIKWVLTNPEGQSKYGPNKATWDRVNAERARLKMESLEELGARLGLSSAGASSEEIETTENGSIAGIAARNAEGIGATRTTPATPPAPPNSPRGQIEEILTTTIPESGSVPDIPQSSTSVPEIPPQGVASGPDISTLMHDLPPQETAELVKDLSESQIQQTNFIKELDARQLSAIFNDALMPRRKIEVLVTAVIRAKKAGIELRPSVAAWLADMSKNAHLTAAQEQEYRDAFPNS